MVNLREEEEGDEQEAEEETHVRFMRCGYIYQITKMCVYVFNYGAYNIHNILCTDTNIIMYHMSDVKDSEISTVL